MGELRLTEDLRCKLKRPLGELITGSDIQIRKRLKEIIEISQPVRVITVGDVVSRFTSQNNIKTDVKIIDYYEMRRKAPQHPHKATNIFTLRNPAGTISPESWQILSQAISLGDSLIIVKGEEDLLALVAISEAPKDSIIVYGQPHKGVVAVKANHVKKEEAQKLLNSMIKE